MQKVYALRGVSVDFYKGQITTLLGHNGAGKTTMMSILTGMMSPTDGIVMIDSKDLKANTDEIMKDLGLCTQDNMYFTSLTVSEQLLFFAKLKGRGKSTESIREDVKDLLENLNLVEKKNALPNTLSGGQKRRLCLGMALVGNTNTLILDEPTSGLDPESRRVIWDILLKMRGQKTVLISTHDMEEADILGDRIAIMHTGQLKSYGTSLFLKRLIGQNNVEITLSTEPRSDPEKIRSEIHKDGIIVSREASKMVVKIPNSPGLPDILDKLEQKKKELGVLGFSVSLISMEQVFLKLTQENDGLPMPQQSTVDEDAKLTGRALHLQTVRALLSKKLIYTLRDYPTILIKLLTILTALVIETIILRGINKLESFQEKLRIINLELYHKPNVLFTSYNKTFSDRYKSIIQSFGGNSVEVTGSNLESVLLQRAKENLVSYDNYLIAAAEINTSSINAFYTEAASYSLPISINFIFNTILQNLMGPDYSISFGIQVLLLKFIPYMDFSETFGYVTALTFASIFCLTVAMFVVHPLREYTTGMKHLQKMTGISGFTYWATMFLFDLANYAFLVVLIIIGFLSIDLSLELRLFGPTEIFLEILLLLLFGINTLPFIYIFSFLKLKTSAVVRLAMYIPSGIVVMEVILNILTLVFENEKGMSTFRDIQKHIFLLLPCVSFTHSQISYFTTVQTNARCHRLPNVFYETFCRKSFVLDEDQCCHLECNNGKCGLSMPFFDDIDKDINLVVSVIYLCLTPMLYFGILAVIENGFVTKLIRKRAKHDSVDPSDDEQVQREKSMIFQQIQTLNQSPINEDIVRDRQADNALTVDNQMRQLFLVYELRKKYKNLKAVEDVNFGVNHGECFGLLGVNGAGKSTTFRMMTGAEIPDHGVMYIGGKDFENNEKYFLSQMGYCPQHDAIMECLNSYHHLRLFARLRGIPEKDVESEVQMWLDKLNLNTYALQPSGTYSGGNKRRLNIGIALIGNPNLIMMDEPTTGVDPGARRSLWNVIKACQKAGQSLVLTSHSMEECEALCNRLAIMVDGKLVCIGASEQLKQRFGAGYDIQIRMDAEKTRDQVDGIKSDLALSLNCVLIDENLGYLMYHVSPAGTTWRKMYDVMNEMKRKYNCIEDFLVLSSSLEQLFLLFAKTAGGNSSSQAVD